MMSAVWTWLSRAYLILALATIGTWAGVSFYWRLAPVSVVRFTDGPNLNLVNGLVYRRGDVLAYRTRGELYVSGIPAEQTRLLMDGVVTILPPVSFVSGQIGPFDTINSSVVVPMSVRPGFYRLQITNVYTINPLRTETIVRTSPVFEVTGP